MTLLPTYIENTKDAITLLSNETKAKFVEVEKLLIDDEDDDDVTGADDPEGVTKGKRSLAKVMRKTETSLLERPRSSKTLSWNLDEWPKTSLKQLTTATKK